ncbi:methionyl-tRNA formyltransferase [Nitrosopumilus sp. b1]|uniref:methionyl-tRNA formyltransferase n=1 Tax=Nitrosopumilus sp. b1 TaxID=2109907 RepID=UPI0015F59DF6|nr:methionyl-tRNA formyltransferase [Nitrosopumilus sp. b1]KAF6244004.1 methionyl-tRNA formyltransferase [Nitrosopumilus sp. b1]
MKIVFISGVKFGKELLKELLENDFDVSAVFSYEESKQKIYSDYSSFDDICKKFNIKNIKVNNINDSENVEVIKSINPDLILVMGWSQLLQGNIISIPKFGVIGSHPTELPKYRGRAPIPWTILKNLKESALTFFYIEEGIDNGDILDQMKFKINDTDDATILYNKIINLGKIMIVKNLKLIQNNSAKSIKQDPMKFIENWPKRTPEDGLINWNKTSDEIFRLIRATTHPYPGAYTHYHGKKLKIFKAEVINNNISEPRKILSVTSTGVHVGTKKGVIILQSIQFMNENESNASLFFSQNDVGDYLESTFPKDTNILPLNP